MYHKDFKKKFKEGWESWNERGWSEYRFMKKLDSVKQTLKQWNIAEFGDVRMENMGVMNRIEAMTRRKKMTQLMKPMSKRDGHLEESWKKF